PRALAAGGAAGGGGDRRPRGGARVLPRCGRTHARGPPGDRDPGARAGRAPPRRRAAVVRRATEGVLLRIFIGDSDRAEGRPLHQVLVERARAMGLAGATVFHGVMGYGRHARVHTAKLVESSGDLPVVIELVDSEDAIARYLAAVDRLIAEGLVTLEKV